MPASQAFYQGLLIVFGPSRPPSLMPARQESLNPSFPIGPHPPHNGVSPPASGVSALLERPFFLLSHPDGQEAFPLVELLAGLIRGVYLFVCGWASHF